MLSGTGLLSEVLNKLPTLKLAPQAVGVLATFYCQRFHDYESVYSFACVVPRVHVPYSYNDRSSKEILAGLNALASNHTLPAGCAASIVQRWVCLSFCLRYE
jgi:hypothetical protein